MWKNLLKRVCLFWKDKIDLKIYIGLIESKAVELFKSIKKILTCDRKQIKVLISNKVMSNAIMKSNIDDNLINYHISDIFGKQ
jgi:hypothetical protein